MFKIGVTYVNKTENQYFGLMKVGEEGYKGFVYENETFRLIELSDREAEDAEEFLTNVGFELVPEITE